MRGCRWGMVALAAALAGCRGAPPRPGDPSGPVQVLWVKPAYRSDGGADFTVLMSVDNREPQPGSATRVRWRLWLQRRSFAEGEQLVAQPLAASGATRFELVFPVALRKAPSAADLVPVELSIRGDLTVVVGRAEQTLGFAKTLVVQAPTGRYVGPDED